MNSSLQGAPTGSGHVGRVLVVDDDRLVLATVVHGLTEAGFEVIDADNGDDAILLAREHRPELALLDIRMEGKSGFDVAATLRDAYRIPFMFLSAFADEATLAKVKELGALDYLTKPLDVGQILPRVRQVLAQVRAGQTPQLTALAGRAGPGGGAAGSIAAAPAPAPLAAGISAPVPSTGVAASLSSTTPAGLIDPVPLAVGVLMHRHSLVRAQAWQRLQKMASDAGLSLPAQAERLLGAIEELARSGA